MKAVAFRMMRIAPCIVAAGCATPAHSGRIQLDAHQVQLVVAVQSWRAAVVAEDFDALLATVLPEARESLRWDLAHEGSALRRVLFGPESVKVLQDVRARLVLIPHSALASTEHGHGTDVCIVAPEVPRDAWPMTVEQAAQFEPRKGVICIFMFLVEGRWYVAYDPLEPPDE